MKRILQFFIFLFLMLAIPDQVYACATCFGDPSAPASNGMNWAIITLLGVTGGVLGGVIGTIISISRKAKKFNIINK